MGRRRGVIFLLFGLSFLAVGSLTASPIARAASEARVTLDRPDEVTGYQIHVIYVVPKDAMAHDFDLNGQLIGWISSSQSWLTAQLGKAFIYDTYQGVVDVSYLPSGYVTADLPLGLPGGNNTLTKLREEFIKANGTEVVGKTLLFIVDSPLSREYCGWGNTPGALALTVVGVDGCGGTSRDDPRNPYGLPYASLMIAHELLHTYGVPHVCDDDSDIMIGSPDCQRVRNPQLVTTIDKDRSHYIGGSQSGIDVLTLPVWNDGSGLKSAAQAIVQNANFSRLMDEAKTVIVVRGKRATEFQWVWRDKRWFNFGNCVVRSEGRSSIGIFSSKYQSCSFDIPQDWRAGKNFTVTLNAADGPWFASESVTGTVVHPDYTKETCTKNLCYVGETWRVPVGFWTTGDQALQLQERLAGKWKVVKTVKAVKDKNAPKGYPYTYRISVSFAVPGKHVYRLYKPATSKWRTYVGESFSLTVIA